MDMETAKIVNEAMTSKIKVIYTSNTEAQNNFTADMKRVLVDDIRNGVPPYGNRK